MVPEADVVFLVGKGDHALAVILGRWEQVLLIQQNSARMNILCENVPGDYGKDWAQGNKGSVWLVSDESSPCIHFPMGVSMV